MSDREIGVREYAPDQVPSTEDLQKPSTEKEPEEAPTAPEREDEQPSHEAVGIGVIGDAASGGD